MNDIILKAENISKQYRLGLVGTGTISHDLNRWWHKVRGKEDPYLKIGEVNDRSSKGNSEYVWALKDINFEVKRGEVLGIIGKNGAGKSTLLKILSKVTSPTTGVIKTKGRIASLLEVGTGFHGEMTGRENIFLNGAILGMTKKEISSKIDEIIDFSGCERYIDTPVKRYSSGMTVRLAFAVAAFLEPEILVIDEVLAVGDAEFQKKAIGKMQDISRGEGRTVLFVSHNMEAVKNLCSRGILMDGGQILIQDNIDLVVNKYLLTNDSCEIINNPKIFNGDNCKIYNTTLNFEGELITNGVDLVIKTTFKSLQNKNFAISAAIFRESNLAFVATSIYKKKSLNCPGVYKIELKIPKYLLNPGNHSVTISFTSETGNDNNYLLKAPNILIFNVIDDNFRRGGIYVQGWGGVVSPILDITWKRINEN
jgi:lipopolysaccharide transport system ATP-binding protein